MQKEGCQGNEWHLDFSKWDDEAPLQLGVKAKEAGGPLKISSRRHKSIHGYEFLRRRICWRKYNKY